MIRKSTQRQVTPSRKYLKKLLIFEKIITDIFHKGFTTKKGDGHGYGLYNVKKIVQKYKGKIEVLIEDEDVIFRITFLYTSIDSQAKVKLIIKNFLFPSKHQKTYLGAQTCLFPSQKKIVTSAQLIAVLG